LQNHSYFLERQLERVLTLNPEVNSKMQDHLRDQQNLNEQQLKEQTQTAQLLSSSTLIQSYE